MSDQRLIAALERGEKRLHYLARIRAGCTREGRREHLFGRGFKRPSIYYPVAPFCPTAYGTTINNHREFEYFRSIIEQRRKGFKLSNLGNQPPLPMNAVHVGHCNGFLARGWDLIEECWRGSQEHSSHTGLLNGYHATYLRSFYIFLASFLSSSIRESVPFALVANDHAPIPIAFAQVCSYFGIPVGYMQHAEVSEKFPPLDYDFAVLNNQISIDIYRRISPALCKTFIVPRFQAPAKEARLERRLSRPVEVGVFLTSLCDFSRIGELFDALRMNLFVQSIRVQPHPRTKRMELAILSELGLSVGKIDPASIDIAVCQNTSSIIELLHHGVKAFQIFEFDFVEDDYYGFVECGIVPRLSRKELSGPFWEKFSVTPEWIEAYARYNPSFSGVDDSSALIEFIEGYLGQCSALGTSIASSLEKTRSARQFTETCPSGDKFVDRLLASVQENQYLAADELVRCMAGSGVISDNGRKRVEVYIEARRVIVELYRKRNPAIVAWMNRGGREMGSTVFGIWAFLYCRFWTNGALNDHETERVVEFLKANQAATFRNELESLSCCLIVRRNNIGLTDWFLKELGGIQSLGLDMRAKTELGRHLYANRERTNTHTWQSDLLAGLSGLNRLRVEIIGCARLGLDDSLSHAGVEREVLEATHGQLRKELERHVLPFYREYNEQLDLMELVWKPSQRSLFVDDVLDSLSRCKGFSYLRLSDGEGWLFSNGSGMFSKADEKNRELHWWGRQVTEHEKATLRGAGLRSVLSADVLGVPSIYRILQSLGSRSTTITNNVTFRGLLQVMQGILALGLKGARFSDEKGNIPLFGDPNDLRNVCQTARNVVIVSSVEKETLREILSWLPEFEHIQVPTHYRTRANPNYASSDKIFPMVYKSIEAKVCEASGPGTLLLNASGIAGKGLIGVAKEKGAVALDVGGAIDVWVQNAV